MFRPLLRNKWLMVLAITVLLSCCCVTSPFSPFWGIAGELFALSPLTNLVRVNDVLSQKYVAVSDIKVLTCDELSCNIGFENQEAIIIESDQQYIEFTIFNAAGQRLEEFFSITEFRFSGSKKATCVYYPGPFVVSGLISTVRCTYPEKDDQICLILDFPKVHPSLFSKEHTITEICQNINGGN
jgi:hypothetical protein